MTHYLSLDLDLVSLFPSFFVRESNVPCSGIVFVSESFGPTFLGKGWTFLPCPPSHTATTGDHQCTFGGRVGTHLEGKDEGKFIVIPGTAGER